MINKEAIEIIIDGYLAGYMDKEAEWLTMDHNLTTGHTEALPRDAGRIGNFNGHVRIGTPPLTNSQVVRNGKVRQATEQMKNYSNEANTPMTVNYTKPFPGAYKMFGVKWEQGKSGKWWPKGLRRMRGERSIDWAAKKAWFHKMIQKKNQYKNKYGHTSINPVQPQYRVNTYNTMV